jgi:hypothetical protein
MYPQWIKTLSHCPFSMSHHVLLTRIQSVGGGKSCLSCPSCRQWFLSAILLHANFKEMVLLLSDPYKFSTWSQLKAETHQSSFALFHCFEIKSVRWLQRCGELQLKTHQLSLSARQRRKWKDAFKRLTHYVQKTVSYSGMCKIHRHWCLSLQEWMPCAVMLGFMMSKVAANCKHKYTGRSCCWAIPCSISSLKTRW